MKKELSLNFFEHSTRAKSAHERATLTAHIGLELGQIATSLSRIDRVPRYADGERENNVEHSYMLGLVAPEIAKALDLPLNIGLVAQYSLVHDLVELKTGDTPTFQLSEHQLLQKAQREREALAGLMSELPPYTAKLLYDYKQQSCPESRFVRYIDKLLPIIVDIIGAGERVMQEDYGVDSTTQLQQCHLALQKKVKNMFGEEFPDLQLAHQLLCELFEANVQFRGMMPET